MSNWQELWPRSAATYWRTNFVPSIPSRARICCSKVVRACFPRIRKICRAAQRINCERLGVEVRTNAMVTEVEAGAVRIGETRMVAPVILWARESRLPRWARNSASLLIVPDGLRCSRTSASRAIPKSLSSAIWPRLKDEHGKPLPGVAPVAMQEGQYVARSDSRRLNAAKPRQTFKYWDKGSLATIGRAAAIAQFGKIHISGFLAWLSWLFMHIFFLIGFRNRLLVFIQWAWSYLTYERGARLITGSNTLPGWEGMHPMPPEPAEQEATENLLPR